MPKPSHTALTRRERQIMDILYRQGSATAAEVMDALKGRPGRAAAPAGSTAGRPNSSTVRTQLRVLEQKGYVRHEERGLRFVYIPAVPRHTARRSALRHLIDTFFDGSAEQVVAAVLGGEATRVSEEELDRIGKLVAKAREER
jgi:BlaI family transcriptional regulator, penicillinase repressor